MITLEQANQYPYSFSGLKSSRASELVPGTVVFYGRMYGGSGKLQETTIKTIDKNGVIKTECGVNFSTKQREITSTKKLPLGFTTQYGETCEYFYLFLPKDCNKEIEHMKKRDFEREEANQLCRLQSIVNHLDKSQDADLIKSLLLLILEQKPDLKN